VDEVGAQVRQPRAQAQDVAADMGGGADLPAADAQLAAAQRAGALVHRQDLDAGAGLAQGGHQVAVLGQDHRGLHAPTRGFDEAQEPDLGA
jgi:hypothetical protein